MDFLRLLSDDLHALRNETKKKYPVVREAVDKALETLPYLQKQYAALLRVEQTAPGPGHPLFKSEGVLRPFLLACNHTNASHKIILLALVSIQRLVSWDAIQQASVGSILRVLQIQAEKNTHVDVQVKLLQTLLQLVTLGFEDNGTDDNSTANSNRTASSGDVTQLGPDSTSTSVGGDAAENVLVGNEDLVMMAIWICIHLHGNSSSASSVVGNTAAMTIRQVVSLAFGKVHKSPEAKHVGVLVFQELCFMSREENGVWLKRTAVSPMSAALGVELLETILSSHQQLFREDPEFNAVLRQHVCSLIQAALEMGCADKHSSPSSSSSTISLSSTSSSNSTPGPFFPLLVRVMRLATTILCNFSDCLPDECDTIVRGLLEVISTGSYSQPAGAKSPSHAKITAQDVKSFLSHGGVSSNNLNLSNSSSSSNGVNFVTWPVLLSLEVLNRVCLEPNMIAAMATYPDSILVAIAKTTSSVITTSPPQDFKPLGNEALVAPRSGLELLNDQDTPTLQQFFSAVRVAVTCQSNLTASIFDLSRTTNDATQSDALSRNCVTVVSPFVIHSLNSVMRHCREVELITMSLKSYHVLATIASRLRANILQGGSAVDQESSMTKNSLDEVVIACLRALCAFSFPLPEGIKGNSRGSVSTNAVASNGSIEHQEDVVTEDGESCIVVISWREVHAMKALFGAAHIMEEELSELEWCILLEGFEIIVGLTDSKLKNGQNKLPTKNYRISAFRVEDEDVEQQLVMLSNSIVEFFRDALKLSSSALRKLLAAVRKVCWEQVGLPSPNQTVSLALSSSSAGDVDHKPINKRASMTTALTGNNSATVTESGDSVLSNNHHMKIYQNFLGVGLTGSGTFNACFALRMLTKLALSSKRCFEEVIAELLLMSTFVPQAPLVASQFPQLVQFQAFTTDNILQLMQNALTDVVNSLSPVAKVPSQASLTNTEAYGSENPSNPHVFDQQELFLPLSKLMNSDMRDRALTGMLELLNSCGHLINTGWPLVLAAIQEAGEVGDSKTQVAAFKCLRLVVDDLLVSIPKAYLSHCVKCIGRFASRAKDVNISLTAVNELWSVADIIGKQKGKTSDSGGQWACLFGELSYVAMDERTEVRNSAINTLFGTAVTYGVQFELPEWQLFMDGTVLPLASKLSIGGKESTTTAASVPPPTPKSSGGSTGYVLHHSRDSAQKQWDESRVLLLTGISRVLQTNWQYLFGHATWFGFIWRELLKLLAVNGESVMAKEVVLASVNTLQTLLQVSSVGDFDQIAQSQPVRAGAGMRVVGGALVQSSTTAPSGVKRSTGPSIERDPLLWEEAFDQLLQLCNVRSNNLPPGHVWKEDEEQEIASAVVAVLVTLYIQTKEYEFKHVKNVERVLDLFEVLLVRHVLQNERGVTHKITNITTNSLQSRVLNAFEDCGSFTSHPQVHPKTLDQLIMYVTLSSKQDDLVFVTRHALTSLAKLYASVSVEARGERFITVLTCIQPFLRFDGDGSAGSRTSSSSSTPTSITATAPSPGKPLTAAQKAATEQWKHALRVLLVLISHGLLAVKLDGSGWRMLLQTITLFLNPSSGALPSYVQSEEDEELVLSVLECLVDSAIALVSSDASIKVGHSRQQYTAFCDALTALLCSGIDAKQHNKPFITCCVRQLATLAIQNGDTELSLLACSMVVSCCSTALEKFAALENSSRRTIASVTAAEPMIENSSSSDISTSSVLVAARERVVILLESACEVALSPRHLMEMFPALCSCITSSDLEVRQLIQRLLVGGDLASYCLGMMDQHERRHAHP